MDGVAVVAGATPYWGEISQEKMKELLAASVADGWQKAVQSCLPPRDRPRITETNRAAFQDILPIPSNSRVLDVGAGLGVISTQLARHHRVTALEGVWERARFIAIRGRQDGLANLTILNGDLNAVVLEENQFDAIIVNGVLEWVGLFDLTAPPEVVQRRFLEKLRSMLAPNGIIYVAIENRIGIAAFRGAEDHSGLRYTSLMPRFLARFVCSQSKDYRSRFNTGYRTYTYSHWGYRSLFQAAGLTIRKTYIPMTGYIRPTIMVPLTHAAITGCGYGRWVEHASTAVVRVKNFIKRRLSKPIFWKTFSNDFCFLLGRSDA